MFLLLACRSEPVESPAAPPLLPDIVLSTDILDFGSLPPSATATAKLRIENQGEGNLSLGIPFIVGGNGEFTVAPLLDTTLATGEYLEVPVSLQAPPWGATPDALLILTSNDPDQPSLEVTLQAHAQDNVVVFEPSTLNFGTLLPDCAASQDLVLRNNGTETIQITELQQTGSTSFIIDTNEAQNGLFPWTLLEGDNRVLHVQLDETLGPSTGLLNAMDGTTMLGGAVLLANRLESSHTEETYALDGGSVDLVIPIQDAGGMTDIDTFMDGFPAFLDALDALKVDYQIAVVMDNDGCAFGDTPFLSSNMNRDEQWRIFSTQMTDHDMAHGIVVAMEATKEEKSDPGGCNEGLVRPLARLAILGYTFVGENHPDAGWMATIAPIIARKEDPADVKIHGIVEDLRNGCGWGAHSYWSDAVDYTGGVWYSICEDVPESLLKIAPLLAQANRDYELQHPAVPESITVTINGQLSTDWEYDSIKNIVHLEEAPATTGELVIAYDILNTCP